MDNSTLVVYRVLWIKAQREKNANTKNILPCPTLWKQKQFLYYNSCCYAEFLNGRWSEFKRCKNEDEDIACTWKLLQASRWNRPFEARRDIFHLQNEERQTLLKSPSLCGPPNWDCKPREECQQCGCITPPF